MSQSAIDIHSLSPDARLDLIEELWDSLDHDALPIPEQQLRELDRRLDARDRHSWKMSTPAELMEHLGRRKK